MKLILPAILIIAVLVYGAMPTRYIAITGYPNGAEIASHIDRKFYILPSEEIITVLESESGFKKHPTIISWQKVWW